MQGAGFFSLEGSLDHPEYKLNAEGPSYWSLEEEGLSQPITQNEISIPLEQLAATSLDLKLKLKLYLCHKVNGVCIARTVCHQIRIERSAELESVNSLHLGSLISV